MQAKTKQRLVGSLVLLAIVAIFLPLLFHNANPSAPEKEKSVSIPAKPKITAPVKQQIQQPISSPVQAAPAAKPTVQTPKPKTTQAVKPKAKVVAKVEAKKTPALPNNHAKQAQIKKEKAQVISEQHGLNEFVNEPKAWTVQLGTFTNLTNANHLIKKLRDKGFDAYTRPVVDAKGHRLLRVYVGPEIRRESAIQLRDKLKASFHLKGVVRKYNIKT